MKYVPHAYQTYCIDRMLTTPSLGLLLDMGLGKTVIALTAVNELKYNWLAISKVLVIAPKKVAESTWLKEQAKWDHLKNLRVVSVLGALSKRVYALNTPADVYVINRDNVLWLVDYYRNSWCFDTVVVDEFSSFKSHDSKRFKALSWVRKHISRFVGLTGTPAPNGLLDLWAQVYLLDGGERLGKCITHFRERYFNYDSYRYSYELKAGAEEIIRSAISDICVSMKAEDYLELPDCTYVTIPVLLDTKAEKLYKELEKEMLVEVDEELLEASTAAVLSNKLLQLCNGAVYNAEREVVDIHSCKIEAFMECIEALNGAPVLVFYNFQHDLTRIKKALSKTKLTVRELKKPKDEDDWNERKIDALLAHPASAAYGLNLQKGGNHVIWFGLNWSLELYLQANKRLHRQGQTSRVIIHHLVVEKGLDAAVMLALEGKNTTQNCLMDALKARIQQYKTYKT